MKAIELLISVWQLAERVARSAAGFVLFPFVCGLRESCTVCVNVMSSMTTGGMCLQWVGHAKRLLN